MSMLGRTGRVPGLGHLNWSLRRWRTSVGGNYREGRSSVREQNGQRHVSIVCIKKCKPEGVSPCTSSWGLVPLLLQRDPLLIQRDPFFTLLLKTTTTKTIQLLLCLELKRIKKKQSFEKWSVLPQTLCQVRRTKALNTVSMFTLGLLGRAAPSPSQVLYYEFHNFH